MTRQTNIKKNSNNLIWPTTNILSSHEKKLQNIVCVHWCRVAKACGLSKNINLLQYTNELIRNVFEILYTKFMGCLAETTKKRKLSTPNHV